jgi:hypothetical protein
LSAFLSFEGDALFFYIPFCSFAFCHAAWGCSFLFRTAERETEPKRKAAGCISEAKNRAIPPKTSKRPPLRSGWTCSFLHGGITRFSSRFSEEAGTLSVPLRFVYIAVAMAYPQKKKTFVCRNETFVCRDARSLRLVQQNWVQQNDFHPNE